MVEHPSDGKIRVRVPSPRQSKNMNEWIPLSERLPDERVIVDTKIDDKDGCRNEQQLQYHNRLWWFPDDSMYVYYTPTHWRETT